MKLTYNANDNTVVIEGTSDEVNEWYRVFIHSQTACQEQPQQIVLPDITPVNQEQKQLVESLIAVNAVPDEDGWIVWTPNSDGNPPDELEGYQVVEYLLDDNFIHEEKVSRLNWSAFSLSDKHSQITKYRPIK